VDLALLRIGEDLVGGRDLLEPVLSGRIGIDVRMELTRQPAIRLLDLLRRRVASHPERPVVVDHLTPH